MVLFKIIKNPQTLNLTDPLFQNVGRKDIKWRNFIKFYGGILKSTSLNA